MMRNDRPHTAPNNAQTTTTVGLRIDVDTLRGTCRGVPNLVDLLESYQIRASFFLSVGPDNMGRHLWRLIRPLFLVKMLRTRAAGLYGWDILLRGTFWPGPIIGKKGKQAIRRAAAAGHEIGLHAWDHHRWQARVEQMGQPAVADQIKKGYNLLQEITGSPPDGFAAPAWRTTPNALAVLERFPFRYQSDCRGQTIFRPVMGGRQYRHIQVPTTLPTYDELIGRTCTSDTYNNYLLDQIRPDRLNILTIHAEVEGGVCLDLFQDFLERAGQKKIVFKPLGYITEQNPVVRESGIIQGRFPGRDGWVACQETEAHHYNSHKNKEEY